MKINFFKRSFVLSVLISRRNTALIRRAVLLVCLVLASGAFFNIAAQNLITNGDFSSGNTGFTSSYTYQTNLVPETTYYVGANPRTYHPSWASFGDHTTGSGLMMIVNGDTTVGSSVWKQSNISVTRNTAYDFSVWAASSYFQNPAVLDIYINSVLVGTINCTSTTGQWIQTSVLWNSGGSKSATIEIKNRNANAGGNDFVIDDISLRAAVRQISGTVFEDTNYAGGAGRSGATAGGVGRPNARVELYSSLGVFVSATTTDASGNYSFTALLPADYTIRVVNSTVT
ncbi:MAG: hypothetical protein M3033_15020 [Acidobacteriota bacterium]|nr:hypothetical protein [Acidobacteriota bacterium]